MATVRHNRKNLPTGETDWQALDQLSDEEVERLARSDPDGQPLTDKDFEKLKRVPRVRIVRMALGMTQEEFAEAYGIPVATLRDWEQCRRQPDTSVKSYLRVIERLPKQVREALAPEPRSVTEGA